MEQLFKYPLLADEFPLTIAGMDPQDPIELHAHIFEELVIITGGRGTHFTRDEVYEIQAGDAFIITRAQAHGYRDTGRLSLVNILFRMEDLPLPVQEMRKLPGYHAFFLLEPEYRERHRFQSRLRLTVEELSELSRLIARLRGELEARQPGFEFLATALFMQIIGALARSYANRRDSRIHSPLVGISEVISYLESQYTEEISLEALAARACMSKSTLFRVFRQATGSTPIEYLLRLRVLHAAELLRAGACTVAEAAFHVGFHDSNYFTRQFRRIMGMTPQAYRGKRDMV